MKKSPEAFRTISEVAETLDVPPHVLRFWETRFTQIKPVKRGGGRRYYRPEDVNLLRGIKGLLYDEGMTIKGAQKILREKGVRHVIGLGTLPDGAPSPSRPGAESGGQTRQAETRAASPKRRSRRHPRPSPDRRPISSRPPSPLPGAGRRDAASRRQDPSCATSSHASWRSGPRCSPIRAGEAAFPLPRSDA